LGSECAEVGVQGKPQMMASDELSARVCDEQHDATQVNVRGGGLGHSNEQGREMVRKCVGGGVIASKRRKVRVLYENAS